MSSFHFEFLLCLNGHPVPMVKNMLIVIDHYALAEAEGFEAYRGGLGVVQGFCRALVDPPDLGPTYKVVGSAQQQKRSSLGDS